MKKRSIYDNLIHNPKNIRFEGLCHAAEKFGFVCRGVKGSHRIYVMEGIAEMLNFQDIGGKAKPYPVKQLCKVIEKYSLLEENGDA
jgi:hypothetical protein